MTSTSTRWMPRCERTGVMIKVIALSDTTSTYPGEAATGDRRCGWSSSDRRGLGDACRLWCEPGRRGLHRHWDGYDEWEVKYSRLRRDHLPAFHRGLSRQKVYSRENSQNSRGKLTTSIRRCQGIRRDAVDSALTGMPHSRRSHRLCPR